MLSGERSRGRFLGVVGRRLASSTSTSAGAGGNTPPPAGSSSPPTPHPRGPASPRMPPTTRLGPTKLGGPPGRHPARATTPNLRRPHPARVATHSHHTPLPSCQGPFMKASPGGSSPARFPSGPLCQQSLHNHPLRATYAPHIFRVLLLRRLRLPLPLAERVCRCRRTLDTYSDHRAACARAGPLGMLQPELAGKQAPESLTTHDWLISTFRQRTGLMTEESKSSPMG